MRIIISAFLIVMISEFAKKSTLISAVVASLPMISILAIIWLYIDSHDTILVAKLSYNIFWLVVPSLLFFIIFPFFLNLRINFYLSFTVSLLLTVLAYFIMIVWVRK